MNIPCTRPITDYGKIGDGARVAVTLADVVDYLPIPSGLNSELRTLSDAYRNASLHVIVEASDDIKHEGRGIYFNSRFSERDITLYTKGVGDMDVLQANNKANNRAEFGAFGPIPAGYFYGNTRKYFYDYPHDQSHFPRVIGAEFSNGANREFLHAMRVMVNLIRTESYASVDDLLSHGVTIPISTSCFPGLTRYIRERAIGELEGTSWVWCDDLELGAVTLAVPSSRRTGAFPRGIEMAENSRCIARGVRKLYESSGAIFPPSSCHMQNFYHAPHSICPSSDNSDLLFDLEPKRRVEMFVSTVENMVFLANSDGGYRINEGEFLVIPRKVCC